MGVKLACQLGGLRDDDVVLRAQLTDHFGEESFSDALATTKYKRHAGLFPRALHHVGEEGHHPVKVFLIAAADVVANVRQKLVAALARIRGHREPAPQIVVQRIGVPRIEHDP